MSEAKQEIKKLKKLLEIENLTIPDYQRPYEWTENHVKILLNDLLLFVYKDNKQYITGNIIVHNDKDNRELNIVDGQQRLVTIQLLLYALSEENKEVLKFSEQEFNEISKSNIQHNYLFIKNWLRRFNKQEKEHFSKVLLSNICFFYTEVDKIEEAFQLFDSQNTRGKSLKPADLLKAFHLQQMDDEVSEKVKRNYVDKWEELSKDSVLNKFIEEHLFRIRKWIKDDNSYYFRNEHVHEFKGITVNNSDLPYFSKRDLIVYHNYERVKNDKEFSLYNSDIKFPFQIDQTIINGKIFFEYIFHFYDEFEKLKKEKSDWADFYNDHCIKYHGWGRTGDYYLRNLFENFSFYTVTRFNANEYNMYFRKVYRNFYFPRVEKDNSRVTISSVENKRKWFLRASQDINLNFIELDKDYFKDIFSDTKNNNSKNEDGTFRINNQIKQVYL